MATLQVIGVAAGEGTPDKPDVIVGPPTDMRCYIRDPNGRIIEVGEATGLIEYFDMANTT